MKKYNNCNLVYKKGINIDVKNVTFEKRDFSNIKLPKDIKKEYLKFKSNLDKVNFISNLLSRTGTNIIIGVGGDAPHKEFATYTGFWKVEGKGVLPKSYLKTISQKDV